MTLSLTLTCCRYGLPMPKLITNYRRRYRFLAYAFLACAWSISACGDDKAAEKRPERIRPVRIALADCAGPTARFQSGPRPMPFAIDAVEQLMAGMPLAQAGSPEIAALRPPLEPSEPSISATALRAPYGFTHLVGQGDASGNASPYPIRQQWASGRALPPQVRIGQAEATGDLDKSIIRRYIRRQLPRIRFCYERQLLGNPALQGTVETTFTITPAGQVTDVQATGMDKEVASCVARTIEGIRFPKPKGGGLVNVRYPFTFRRADDSDSASQDRPAPGAEPTDGPSDASSEGSAPTRGQVERAALAGFGDDGPKDRGSVANPLRAHIKAVDACLRQTQASHGALFVEMQVDPMTGAVTAATSVGLDDQPTGDCVASVAEAVVFQLPARAVYRCPLAFGDTPASALTTIDITAESISLAGKPIAATAKVAADESGDWRLDALRDRLLDRASAARRSLGQQPIAITGPHVIRPDDGIPMKVLFRVLRNIWSIRGENWALSARDPRSGIGGWRLLHHDLALPVAPVPLYTGAPWLPPGRAADGDLDGPGDTAPVVVLSVLVEPEAMTVVVSPIDDVRRIAWDQASAEYDWKALREVLDEHKRSTYFVDRHDLQIAGADTVRFRTVVEVIDIASEVGFTDWRITDPASLSIPAR